MKEIKAIVTAYNSLNHSETKAALATVVRVEGSSYRRMGARMLVMDNGVWVGGISGGCLEGDALKKARLAIFKKEPTLITYDTSTDDEHQIGVGLGCNGIIDVLFTPLVMENSNNLVEILKKCLSETRKTHILLTCTEGKKETVGQAILYKTNDDLHFLEEKDRLSLQQQIEIQREQRRSGLWKNDNKMTVFIELLPPEIHVILMGHQYDVYPLLRLLKEIDWRVSVVAKPEKVNKLIASLADAVVSPEDFSDIVVDEYTAIILMSHDYETDKKNLPKALRTVVPYIGMLGPKVRSERIWQELTNEGYALTTTDYERIFAPLGLDIGAVVPEEIAVSLVAEIRAVFSERKGGFLRLRSSAIHERLN